MSKEKTKASEYVDEIEKAVDDISEKLLKGAKDRDLVMTQFLVGINAGLTIASEIAKRSEE